MYPGGWGILGAIYCICRLPLSQTIFRTTPTLILCELIFVSRWFGTFYKTLPFLSDVPCLNPVSLGLPCPYSEHVFRAGS